MAKKLRIDKILSNLGYGSRAELKVTFKIQKIILKK